MVLAVGFVYRAIIGCGDIVKDLSGIVTGVANDGPNRCEQSTQGRPLTGGVDVVEWIVTDVGVARSPGTTSN